MKLVVAISGASGAISSGSCKTGGMIVAPCSIKTLTAIVDHSVGRILDMFDLECNFVSRWEGVAGKISLAV